MRFLDRELRRAFRALGTRVSTSPKYFIIASLILCLTLGTGLVRLQIENDVTVLYIHRNAESKAEKRIVKALFPQNMTGAFSPSRVVDFGRGATFTITAKDGGSILRPEVWAEMLELDSIVRNLSISWAEEDLNYGNICARWAGTCFDTSILDLGELIPEIQNGSFRLSYPVTFNPKTYNSYVLPLTFGGIQLDNKTSSTVSGIQAARLTYIPATETPDQNIRGAKWEVAILSKLAELSGHWSHIEESHYTLTTATIEQESNVASVMPHFAFTIFLMIVFTIGTSMSRDWVRAKPWVALAGIYTAFLGTIGACGFLAYIGVPWIGINIAVPFIMLGIGIDDTFVMLAAWRSTSRLDPVQTRLGSTYAEAAVSITITSLTDMLSFYVGLLTPIPSIQYFCAYAGTSILGIYLVQIFCLGAILAISGDQEAGNRHSVFFWVTATPKSKADGKSKLYRIFCTGGIDKMDPANTADNTENSVMVFFRDSFSRFLFKTWVKVLVLLMFAGYLAVSVWGVIHLEDGLKEERLYRDDSYASEFILKDVEYFRDYPFRVQVVISTPLDYSQNETQAQIENVLSRLIDSSPYMTSDYQENWLSAFLDHVRLYSELTDFNITTEQSFLDTLRTEFLPGSPFAEDVKFDPSGTRILATRYILQAVQVRGAQESKTLLRGLRAVAISESGLNVTVFNPRFVLIDQFLIIQSMTVMLVSIAAGVVMVVAIIFIPNPVSAWLVFLTIGSVELGVLGLMSLWDINLDMISILTLLMCIGFSVDFCAHVSYAYISAEGSSEDRIQRTFHALGLPIVQGAGSTILGVVALVVVPSYIFQVFFKIITLVILISTWHGLVLLPVILLILKPERFVGCCGEAKSVTISTEEYQNGKKKGGSVIPVDLDMTLRTAAIRPTLTQS